jgi:hypothetical protein
LASMSYLIGRMAITCGGFSHFLGDSYFTMACLARSLHCECFAELTHIVCRLAYIVACCFYGDVRGNLEKRVVSIVVHGTFGSYFRLIYAFHNGCGDVVASFSLCISSF